MTSPFSLPAVLNPPMTSREAVVDALYRCVMAFDTPDTALFDSSFMPEFEMFKVKVPIFFWHGGFFAT